MSWTETRFEGDPIAAVKLILSSHATGKIVLDTSQGRVLGVSFLEKVKKRKFLVDNAPDEGRIMQAT